MSGFSVVVPVARSGADPAQNSLVGSDLVLPLHTSRSCEKVYFVQTQQTKQMMCGWRAALAWLGEPGQRVGLNWCLPGDREQRGDAAEAAQRCLDEHRVGEPWTEVAGAAVAEPDSERNNGDGEQTSDPGDGVVDSRGDAHVSSTEAITARVSGATVRAIPRPNTAIPGSIPLR